MINSATLLGSSSGRNAGDAALISGIMDSVDRACQLHLTYEIPTIKPRYIRENYAQDARPVSMLPWNGSVKMLGIPTYRSVMKTDITLIFDAILFDRALYNPLFNFMSTLYLLLPHARKRGKRMAFFNVGAGPVSRPAGRRMLKVLADCMDFMAVRDQDSYQILAELGVDENRLLLTADAALNVERTDDRRVAEIFSRLDLDPQSEILAINVNAYIDTWASPNHPSMGREKFISVYAAALNQAARKLQVPILFVCTQHLDVGITKEIMAQISSPAPLRLITNVDYNHYDIKGVLSKVSLLFAMRLHAMILASSDLTPIIGLAYQPKCEYYHRTLGLEDSIMSFGDFSENALVEHILRGWGNRAAIRAQLERRIPVLKASAHHAGELVASIARGEDILGKIRDFKASSTGSGERNC